MMGEIPHISVDNQVIQLDGGNCKSKCLIYIAQCCHCLKLYVGKTIQELRSRIAGHRSHVKSYDPTLEITDENCLAAHIAECHGTVEFNDSYKFSVLEHVSTPSMLLIREQHYINSLRTFKPFGLNLKDPIGLEAKLVPTDK